MSVPQIEKRKLSASTDGQPISIAATSSPGTTLHTAQAGTTDGQYDEVWLWAANVSGSACDLVLQFGGTGSSDVITIPLPAESGLLLVCPGIPLQNSKIVRGYAEVAAAVNVVGYVNRLTA